MPATELLALMGHEDLSTTQRYVRVTGWDLERAMARLKAWREAKNSVALEDVRLWQTIRRGSSG